MGIQARTLVYLYILREVIRSYWKAILLFSGALTGVSAYFLLSGSDTYMCELEFVPPDFSVASPLLKNAALVPGTASDLERTYSYLHSFSLKQELIDSFNLYKHYGLDKISNPRRRAKKLDGILKDNIQISITKNATIAIRVYDSSPDFAYQVASFLKDKVEKFCKDVIGMEKALSEKVRQIDDLLIEMRVLEEKLAAIRTEYRIVTSGVHQNASVFIPTKEAFAQYDKVLSMENRLVQLQETYANLLEEKGRREDFLRTYSSPIFIIQPPYKPSYPIGPEPVLVIGLTLVSSLIVSIGLLAYAYSLGLIGRKSQEIPEAIVASP